jgi:hypothetical protein
MVAEIGTVPAIAVLLLCIAMLIWWRNRASYTHVREDVGWLYFIGNGEGPIKVGITRGTPIERCRDLQTGNPKKLKVLYSMRTKNPEMTEAHMHDLLGQFHVGGEWYQRDAVQFLIDELRGKNVIPITSKRDAI